MKSLYITRHGGVEVLKVKETPDLKPGPGQVAIRVDRAGLNFSDIAARLGLYPDAPAPPMVMGYEASGTVIENGPGADAALGSRVGAFSRFGGQTDRLVVPVQQTFVLPSTMTFDQAAALPVNYLTALHLIRNVGRLRPVEKILIHSAAGGVGLAAVQIAREVAEVEIFGTASSSKHSVLREMGIDHPIDYKALDFEEEVLKITGGEGLNLVLDAVGGRSWKKSYRILAPSGHLITYGWTNMIRNGRRSWFRLGAGLLTLPWYNPMSLINANKTVSGVNLGRLWNEEERMKAMTDTLLAMYQAGQISPRVDRVFPLSEAAEAHRYLAQGKNIGKVLFDCNL